MVKDESIMNLMIPKPSGGDKNLRTFGLIVFLSTASYYCIQVAKVYLWPFSLVVEVALLVSLVAFYLFFVASKPEVHCDNQKFKAFVRKRMPMLKERYWITPWAWEGNIHTFLASLFGNLWPFAPKEVTYSREVLQLKDGGEIALDWKHECGLASPASTDDESDDSGVKMSENGRQHHGQHPVVLIMPGITGDSSMVYVRSLVLELSKLGVCCVVFNNRGLGGMRLKTARTYCGCNTDDVEEVVQHLKRSLPQGTPLASVGVSLGALIMCHYLSKKGKDTGFLGSVAICPPWDVFKGCELLETGWPNRYFNYHIAHCLHDIYDREKAIFEEQIGGGPAAKATSALVLSSRTIREFDDRFTAPQFGYPSVDAYYADARMTEKLQNVRTPLLGLAAADDPFHPADGIPVDFGPEAPVAMVVTKRGGHIGYLEGVLPYLSGPPYYARLARDFMAAVFSSREKVEEIIQDVSRN